MTLQSFDLGDRARNDYSEQCIDAGADRDLAPRFSLVGAAAGGLIGVAGAETKVLPSTTSHAGGAVCVSVSAFSMSFSFSGFGE